MLTKITAHFLFELNDAYCNIEMYLPKSVKYSTRILEFDVEGHVKIVKKNVKIKITPSYLFRKEHDKDFF